MRNYYSSLAISAAGALVICLLLMVVIIKISHRFNLVDKPNERKVHKNPVPRFGGIAIFFSALLGLLLNSQGWQLVQQWPVLFTSVAMLFVVGVWDDVKEVSPRLRLVVQVVCSIGLALSGLRLTSLYGVFGIYQLTAPWQYALTILIIVGTTNAFNLIDGVDGLAGGLALIGIVVLGCIAFALQLYALVVLLAAVAGALTGFLKRNTSPASIFMGDGGSLVLGFLLSSVSLLVLQKAQSTPLLLNPSKVAILVTSILVLPVFDTIRVFMHRLLAGKYPFAADKTHIHHLFLVAGMNHRKTSWLLYFFELLLVSIAFFLSDVTGVSIVLVIMVAIFHAVTKVLMINHGVEEWLAFIKKLERGEPLQ